MRTQVSIYKCNSIKKYIGFQLLCFVISIIGNTLNAQNTLSQTNISLQVRDIFSFTGTSSSYRIT